MSEENIPAETSDASDAQSEVESGSQHFAIGDLPPGAEAAESEPAATEEDSGGIEEDGSVAPSPPESFWSFKTADGTEKTFSSGEEAQQFFSSWNGRLSKAERELNEVTRLNYQWQNAYERGELGNEPVPQGENLKEAAEKAESSGSMEAHDWAAVNQYIKNGEGEKALQYIQWRNGQYLQKQVESIEQKFESRLNELTAPAQFQNDVAEAMTYAAQKGYAAVDDMGQPLYPEFQAGDKYDKDFVMHFRDIWLDQDYRIATDPNGTGFRAAYFEAKATYKPAKAPESAPAESPVSIGQQIANAALPRNPDGTFAKRNQALSMSDSNPPASGSPTGGKSGKRGDILDQMRDIGTSRSQHFAVSPD